MTNSPPADLEKVRIRGQQLLAIRSRRRTPFFLEVIGRDERHLFDAACDAIHYAGACRRVGRCMRLALFFDGQWAGGTVLGSPFPNIAGRDEAFGLTAFTRGYRSRGLVSPWAAENREYWDRLQRIVNHARTFVFPSFQGHGLGVAALSLLPTQGRDFWEARYGPGVVGFDTHCTSRTSRLFSDNGWTLVGRTKGFARDRKTSFSRRVAKGDVAVTDNAGLRHRASNTRWWTWIRSVETGFTGGDAYDDSR